MAAAVKAAEHKKKNIWSYLWVLELRFPSKYSKHSLYLKLYLSNYFGAFGNGGLCIKMDVIPKQLM